jgi:serine phosphatase RsbU (regulator of sigma subunit)
VSSKSTTQLRLHTEQVDDQPSVALAELDPLCRAFETATGWQLRYEVSPVGFGETWATPIDASGKAAGRLALVPGMGENDGFSEKAARRTSNSQPDAHPKCELSQARPLALAIASQVNEITRLRQAVWQREAELAAGVPVAARKDEEPHLAERLEAVLKAGADSVGCQAAGLYLLDDATSSLKLRAMWNLPEERLLAPPRPLRGAMADLEALVGHAVALEDATLVPHWKCPEDFAAAVCVPVSSPSIPLGTLWVFSSEARGFSAEQTNLLEIIAGRLAADLDREMLLAAGTKSKQRNQQMDLVKQWQRERLPSVAPLIDDYEIAAWTQQADEVGGDFHDWIVLADGRLALTVGDADGVLLEAALGAATVQASVRAHAAHRHSPGKLLSRVNESLIAGSPGGTRCGLAYALIEPESGEIVQSIAGPCAALIVGEDNQEITTSDAPLLGDTLDVEFGNDSAKLRPGEAFILMSGGACRGVDAAGLRIGEPAVASLVGKHLCDSAEALATRIRTLFEHGGQISEDMTVLVVKRRTSA